MADHLFGITDAGRVRENNEDLFIAEEVMDKQFMIAGVIDGVGGYAGGEVAAALAKEIILNKLSLISKDVIAQLIDAFNLANDKILAKKKADKELAEMACVATLVVIDRQNNQLHYIHVGDTRLYLFRDSSLVKISHDQSFVGFLEDSGRITEEAAMLHPKRNQINQALGLDGRAGMTDTYFETGSSPFLPGDVILICSDGLTDLVNKGAISTIMGSPSVLAVKAAELVGKANAAGGKDNITVVLARNDKTPALHDISRPATDSHPLRAAELPVIPTENLINPWYSNRLVIVLSFFCLLFLGTTIWLFSMQKKERSNNARRIAAIVPAALNSKEKMLSDTLAKLKGDTLVLSADLFNGPVRLSQPLIINRDTLVIKTAGNVVFQCDTTYKGPALVLSKTCKYIVIDKLVFENFETGIVSYPSTLDLKNVRFSKVKHPVQLLFEFPAHTFVNGRLTHRVYQTDSVERK